MMDEGIGKPPLIASFASGFHTTEEVCRSGVELNKKRKLQYELDDLGLPLPKHKFRDRFNISGHGSPAAETPKRAENLLKEIISREVRDRLEQQEDSENDSNSLIEDYDKTEGYVTAMALDIDAESGKPSGKIFLQDWPSTSFNSFDSNILRSSINSLKPRNIIEASNREQAEGDVEQFDPGCENMEEQHPSCETYGDYLISEFGNNPTGHLDAAAEDEMLYSNAAAPNAFVLSSGSWSTGQDARLAARKPTIDQEFEQYFSMLML